MKPRQKLIRAALFFTLLIAIGILGFTLAFPALQNMLTPLSTRYIKEGDAFLADNRLPESVLSYRQAVEADPKSPGALVALAGAYQRQGRLRMAGRYLKLAAGLSKNPPLLPTLPSPENSPAPSLTLSWLVPAAEAAPTGGLFANDMLVAVYEDGSAAALRGSDGALLWKIRLPAPLTSAPAADGTFVYVGDLDGVLHALRLADGSQAWSFSAGSPLNAAPLAAGESIYSPSSGGTLYALTRDGSLRWKFKAPAGLNGTPALADGRLYFGSNDGKLYALDAASGSLAWPEGIQTNGAVESQPAVVDGRVIFGSGDSRVYALAAASGGQYWHYSTPDSVYARSLVEDGVVYIASSGSTLSAVDFLSGKRLWQTSLPAPLRSSPLLHGERIYQAGEANPDLFVLDRETGKLIETIATGDWTAAGPWIEGDTLYLLGKDGAALAYHLPG